MSPHQFFQGFSDAIREIVEKIAEEEIAAAQKRIEQRAKEAVQNYSITMQDTLQRAADPLRSPDRLEVTVRVDFNGLSRT